MENKNKGACYRSMLPFNASTDKYPGFLGNNLIGSTNSRPDGIRMGIAKVPLTS